MAVAGRCRSVVLLFLYWSLRRVLELVVLRFRSEREKEVEILLLRHQLQLLLQLPAPPVAALLKKLKRRPNSTSFSNLLAKRRSQ